MATAYYSHPDCRRHDMGRGHPECPQRLDAIHDHLLATGLDVALEFRDAPAVDLREVEHAHSSGYVAELKDVLEQVQKSGEPRALDPDTLACPDTWRAVLRAAGAAVAATDAVLDGEVDNAFCAVRPPGHHATRNEAMGFCFFNNVAIAARHALDVRGLKRVAIVDFDVHHGNGTQHCFEDDPAVMYVSIHQWPYYPGTGASDETGVGQGKGFTVNLPLEAGAADADYRLLFEEVVVPVLRQFKPDVLLVSAGFDAHERDPLASMRLTTASFGAMTSELRRVAEECCNGRMALVTEGGYDLRALAASLDDVVEVLASPISEPQWPKSDVAPDRGRACADTAKQALAPFWAL